MPDLRRLLPLVLIALLATCAIGYQNQVLMMAFTWAWIHGAGASSLPALLPAAIALAAISVGGLYAYRRLHVRPTLAFAIYVMAVVVLNERVLPVTPLSTYPRERTMKAVVVTNVHDEPFLSAQGLPIGIRLSFDAAFPETGGYFVSPTVLVPAGGEIPYDLQFGHSTAAVITPAPASMPDSVNRWFERGRAYTFRIDFMPNFISEGDRGRRPCIAFTPTQYVSEEQFRSALSSATNYRYRGAIEVEDTDRPSGRILVKEYVTSHTYDLQAMHDAAASAGGGRCKS